MTGMKRRRSPSDREVTLPRNITRIVRSKYLVIFQSRGPIRIIDYPIRRRWKRRRHKGKRLVQAGRGVGNYADPRIYSLFVFERRETRRIWKKENLWCTDPLNLQTCAHAHVHATVELKRKCARSCAGVRACKLRSFRSDPFGRRGKKGTERRRRGKRRVGRESYMKITYSLGPALKRPRTYNRRQLKASHTSMPGSWYFVTRMVKQGDRPFLLIANDRRKSFPDAACYCGTSAQTVVPIRRTLLRFGSLYEDL